MRRLLPWWPRLAVQFNDPLIYLLLAAVLVSLVAWAVQGAGGVPYDAIAIVAIVVLNAVLGFARRSSARTRRSLG